MFDLRELWIIGIQGRVVLMTFWMIDLNDLPKYPSKTILKISTQPLIHHKAFKPETSTVLPFAILPEPFLSSGELFLSALTMSSHLI
jgi:hypothetical protein